MEDAAIVTAAIAALSIASPYYTLWRLKNAIGNKDSPALESIVDWPRIREQVRSNLVAASFADTLTDKDGFGALGTALGAALAAQLIETFVNPAAVIRASDNNPKFAERLKTLDVMSGYFLGPTTFRLDIEGPPIKFGDDPTELGLILAFQGTGWRVTHVDVPWNEIQKAQESAASSSPASPVTTNKADVVPSCKIENWKYHGLGSHTIIEGTTSCATGTVHIQAYDDKRNYLGNAKGYIQANSFTSMLSSPAPAKLEIKYQVTAD